MFYCFQYHILLQESKPIMQTNKLSLTLIVMIIAIINCGVTDIPNDKNAEITGMVSYKNNKRTANATVILRKIILTSAGDSIVDEKESVTDSFGNYGFINVDNGTYVIYSHDSVTGMSAIFSKLQKSNNSDMVYQELYLDNDITIKGRIVTKLTDTKPIMVFIPGLDKQSQIDSNGYYQLESIPKGQYDLGFVYNNSLNFLSIKTTGN